MNSPISIDSIRKNGTITPQNVTWKPWRERPDKYTGELNRGAFSFTSSDHKQIVNKDRRFRKAEVIRLRLKNMQQYRKAFKKLFKHNGELKCY